MKKGITEINNCLNAREIPEINKHIEGNYLSCLILWRSELPLEPARRSVRG